MTAGSTIIQSQTIPGITAGWTQSVSFVRFDPSLDTLHDVRIWSPKPVRPSH